VEQVKEAFWLRVGATGYYGIVCSLAVHRFVAAVLGSAPAKPLTHLGMVTFVGLALTGWYFMNFFERRTDRIAALLYGVFYALRVGTEFVNGRIALVLLGLGSAVIVTGMVAMILGFLPANSGGAPEEPKLTREW
jgi:hypothetical protein